MRILQKMKRELWVALSKLCKKEARSDYMGLNLKFPLLYGMGRGYIIPAEFWMSECLKAFVNSKQGSVLDIGANVGLYLVKLKAISKDTSYYGFEPNHVCNFYIQELIRLNNFTRANIFPFALSDKKNVQMLYASKRGDKMASLVESHKTDQDKSYSLNIFTYPGDEFINMLDIDAISAIKIDVEGHELEVLTGIADTIKKYRPFLYCEVLGFDANEQPEKRERALQVYNRLLENDYSIYGVNNRNNSLEKIQSPDDLGSHFSPEYIFVPNEMTEQFFSEIRKQALVKI